MTINTDMFQKIYDQISQHPETHDQMSFEKSSYCGTTRCVAGWAIYFAYNNASIYDVDRLNYRNKPGLSSTSSIAADILGLTSDQAHDLFYESLDHEAVEKCLRYATKGDEA